MAKLTAEQLAEGRKTIVDGDREAFKAWHKKHFPLQEVDEHDGMFFAAIGAEEPWKLDMALRVYDKVYMEADPSDDVRAAFRRLGCMLFVLLMCIGSVCGIVVAVKGCL